MNPGEDLRTTRAGTSLNRKVEQKRGVDIQPWKKTNEEATTDAREVVADTGAVENIAAEEDAVKVRGVL